MQTINRRVGGFGSAFLAALLAGGAVVAAAAPSAPPAKAGPVTAPRAVVEKPEIDAGRVTRGKVLEAAFELRNDGDADLRVLSAKPG